MTTEKQILVHREASARDRSLKCISCDEYKSSNQLIYCLDCNRVMCIDHSVYDAAKKDETARMIPAGMDAHPVFVRFGTCNDCIEHLDEISFDPSQHWGEGPFDETDLMPEMFAFDSDFSDMFAFNGYESEWSDSLRPEGDAEACDPIIYCPKCACVFHFEHYVKEYAPPEPEVCAPLISEMCVDALEWSPEVEV